MNISEFIKEGELFISPLDEHLTYMGRMGLTEANEPEWTFPATSVSWRFKGTGTAIVVSSKKFYWDVFAGCMLDGRELTFKLPEDGTTRIEIGEKLPDCDHIVTFFKRQDACNIFQIHGIILAEGSELHEAPQRPERRIEVYGDSVSAGEVSEAVEYVARPDPEGHEGWFSNCRYSYSSILARRLGAELHDIAQGGVALLQGTGWFAGPDYVGMEQIYDKVKYYPDLEHATTWDFTKYIPHVVIVAFGQNDANPDNFMAKDYDGDKAANWREHYVKFLSTLRGKYPKAYIICTTTILGHDAAWDRAIDECVKLTNDSRISHFLYTNNGTGTPGHIRRPEAEKMAEEIGAYIEALGEDVWKGE